MALNANLKVIGKGEKALPFSLLDDALGQYRIPYYQRLLPFFEKEILDSKYFSGLNAAEKEDLSEQLGDFFDLIEKQIHLDQAFKRQYNMDQLEATKARINALLFKFSSGLQRSPNENKHLAENLPSYHLPTLPMRNWFPHMLEVFYSFLNQFKKGASKNIKRAIAAENGVRLYWVWSSSFLNSVFTLLKLDLARQRLSMQVPVMGALAAIPYFFRGFLELGMLIKHTLPLGFLSSEEKQLSLSQRFHYQWRLRGEDVILNDLPWATVNLIGWIGLFGLVGTCLNLMLFVSDFIFSIRRFKKNEVIHQQRMDQLTEELTTVKMKMTLISQSLTQKEDLLRQKLLKMRALLPICEKELLLHSAEGTFQHLPLKDKNILLQESNWKKLQESALNLKKLMERVVPNEHFSEDNSSGAHLRSFQEKIEDFSDLVDVLEKEKIKQNALEIKELRLQEMTEDLALRFRFKEKSLKLTVFYSFSLIVGFAAVAFVAAPLVLAIAGTISFLSMVSATAYRHQIRLERAKALEAFKAEEETILKEAAPRHFNIALGKPIKGGLHGKAVKDHARLFSGAMLEQKEKQIEQEHHYYQDKKIFIKKNLSRELINDLVFPCLVAGILIGAPSLGLGLGGIMILSVLALAAKLLLNRSRPSRNIFFRKETESAKTSAASNENFLPKDEIPLLKQNSARV